MHVRSKNLWNRICQCMQLVNLTGNVSKWQKNEFFSFPFFLISFLLTLFLILHFFVFSSRNLRPLLPSLYWNLRSLSGNCFCYPLRNIVMYSVDTIYKYNLSKPFVVCSRGSESHMLSKLVHYILEHNLYDLIHVWKQWLWRVVTNVYAFQKCLFFSVSWHSQT